MKLCNAEIMKKVKLLEQNKSDTLAEERRINQVTYQTESDKIDFGYSFAETRKKVEGIDSEIRKLKRLLNYSNATTVVEEFDMTLGECLVYMAQLNNELGILEPLARKEPLTRSSTYNGVIEYTVLNYDKAECQARLQWIKDTLSGLQIAIDRTNLTNMIDIG
ncbi:MAG: hypothetical protein FWC32_02570 [Firmicutes bacterium]|nr:hypothetical protein [Bacillota bacterium]